VSRFNAKAAVTTRTVNYAGGEAFTETTELEFVSILLTSFVQDQYYRSSEDTVERTTQLLSSLKDKRFAARAALYARTKFGMRSISHVVAAEIARSVKGESWTKDFFDRIVYRPDDMTEILALSYQYAKNEPNALRKGFAKALTRFSEYELAKYRKEGSAVSLVDVVNVVHPANTEAIAKLVKGTLPTPETWETKLTKAGQEATNEEEKTKLKADAWEGLVKERKIGYFALLRNLRNILEQNPKLIPDVLVLLTDEDLIKKSLVLPFRFTTAIEEIQKLNGTGVREVLGALSIALDKSAANVPHLDGKTLVIVDGSGSMNGRPMEIASLFGAILYKANDADLMLFSDDAKYFSPNPMDSTMTISGQISRNAKASGTNFHAPLQEANRAYDRLIFLSDMQGWVGYNAPTSTFNEYKRRTGANPKVYSLDLAGYGSLQFPQNSVFALSGFSEKIFDVMKLLEQDKNALITEINKVEL
jgi:hypothetical protein